MLIFNSHKEETVPCLTGGKSQINRLPAGVSFGSTTLLVADAVQQTVACSSDNNRACWVWRGNKRISKKAPEDTSTKKKKKNPGRLKASMSFHVGATTTAASK